MSDLAVTPERLGVEIRELTRQAKAMTVYYAVEIGRRLTAAKSMVPHGGWADWIHENTEFSQTTATRMMRIFDEYGAAQIGIFGAEPNSSTLQNLSISNALRLLAVPEDERETFAEAIDAENLSARELDKAIRERDAAVADRDNARREANVYSLRTKKAQQELVRTRKEAELLKEQLAEAKKKMEAATGTGEKRQILDEIEALKRKLAMADTAVTAARLYFEQWQKVFHELAQAVASIEDEEKAEKLRAAIKAQLSAWGKKMGLTDGRMPTPESPEQLRWRTDRDFPDGPVLLLIYVSENGSILYETDDVQGGKLGWFEEPDDGEILRWLPLPGDPEEGDNDGKTDV